MRFCYNCGADVRDGQKFCSGCGADVSSPPPGTAPATPDRAPVTAAPPVAGVPPVVHPAPAQMNKTLLIVAALIGIAVIMLIVVAVVGYFVVLPMIQGNSGLQNADDTKYSTPDTSFMDTLSSGSGSGSTYHSSETLELVGNTYGKGSGGKITTVTFSVALAPGAAPVDFDDVDVVLTTENGADTINYYSGSTSTPSAGTWAISEKINSAGSMDNDLESGEMFNVAVSPSTPIYANDKFSIELKPPSGSSLAISRTAPGSISSIMVLY